MISYIKMISVNNITNPKCSTCKCYFIPTIKSSGQLFKTCDKCRTKDKEAKKNNKCPHDKRQLYCKKCGGNGICEHSKRKTECKNVSNGGNGICEHSRDKRSCKECNPKLCLLRLHTKQIRRYLTSTRYEK